MSPDLRNLINIVGGAPKGFVLFLPHHRLPLGSDGEPLPVFAPLMQEPIWLGWRKAPKPGKPGKFSKPPISLKTMRSDGWKSGLVTYEEAISAALSHNAATSDPQKHIAGVGILPNAELGVACGDLDDCIDDGKLTPWAREILIDASKQFECYAERSPSGDGVRFIARGAGHIVPAANNVELYDSEDHNYVTVTGRHIENAPTDLVAAPRTIAAMLARAGIANESEGELDTDADCLGMVLPKRGTTAEVRKPASPANDDEAVADLRSETPMAAVNSAALASLDKWVPKLFGDNARKSGKDTWRISSAKLGRDMQEDLSIDRKGVKDFGLHDQEDARDGKRTPVDLFLHEDYQCVIAEDYQGIANSKEAALRLCDLIGRPDLKELFSQFKPFRPIGNDDPAATLATPEWPAGTLPAELEDHTRRIAARMRAAPGAAAFAHFVTMAACIPAGVRADVLRDGTFLQRANVFALLVGRPGAAKSPILDAAQGPLMEAESEWRVVRKRLQTEAARTAAMAKRRKATPPPANDDPTFEATEEPTDDNPATLGGEATQKGDDRMRVVTDATMEKTIRLAAQYPDGLILAPGEFEILMGGLDRYASGSAGSKDANVLIVGHDGKPYRLDRVTSETVEADALVVSIVSSTQPSVLGTHLGDPRVGNGLFQRMLLVPMGSPAAWRSDEPLDPQTTKRYRRSVRRLLDLTRDHGDLMLPFSPEAVSVWRQADDWAVQELRTAKSETEGGVIGKTGMHVTRLALALELIWWAWGASDSEVAPPLPDEVSGASARRAFHLWRGFLLDGIRQCLRLGSRANVDADVKRLADFLVDKLPEAERRKPLTAGLVGRHIRGLKEPDAMDRAAGVLVERGWLAPASANRKGSAAWKVNPEVWAA